jgi:hypothetical protein
MAVQAVSDPFARLGFSEPRWSPRRRIAFIFASAAGLWALPVALIYALTEIL